ncbi:MAG TPA: nuclear transport factor 2 family protein [Gaiellaceae bacterium]|nr:nuclear transport factor 2 family protein [Gaiellaceae bacterium]
MTPERLAEALEAWNTGDAERVLAFFAVDCAYHASFGPELLGRSYIGREAVRAGVRAFFERYPGGRFEDTRLFVAGDRGAAEWTFVAPEADGTELRVRGCDLFEFDGDVIRVKNAFRKQPG